MFTINKKLKDTYHALLPRQLFGALFLFIDEFDAYFHYSLSKFILERLFSNDNIEQVALSSHSTSLIDNEILRPDCYFVLNDKGKIKQFSEITDKKIEEYHNIEKMYRTEVFEYE